MAGSRVLRVETAGHGPADLIAVAGRSGQTGICKTSSDAGNITFRGRVGGLAMPVRSIDHVQLAMPPGREAEARAFYAGVLGLPEVEKPPHLARRGGCWFGRDGLKVHLGVEADFRPAR